MLRGTVVGLAALQTIQPATKRADWFNKIAVDGPPKGDGTLIELTNDKGETLASVIMGKEVDIGDTSGAAGIYIRKPGSGQAWLARSVFEPKSDVGDGLDKTVVSIDRARIQSVDVTPISGPAFSAHRDQTSDADLAKLGFSITDLVDPVTHRPFTLIQNEPGTERAWGMYLIDRTAAPSLAVSSASRGQVVPLFTKT